MMISENPLNHLHTLDLVSNPIWLFDLRGRRMVWANLAAIELWKASSLAALCNRDFATSMSESVLKRLTQYEDDFATDGLTFREQWTIYPEDEPVPLTVNLKGFKLPDGNMGMFVEASAVTDQTPEAIRSVDALLHTAAMISLFSDDGRPLYRNPAARESVRKTGEHLTDRFINKQAINALVKEVDTRGATTQTLAVRTANGSRWHEISARYCRDPLTGEHALLISELDVSAIKRTEAHAKYLSEHDPLTGLPNRTHVIKRFNDSIGAVRHLKQEAALVFIDLDHFKDVNDSLGHHAGDKLLVVIAQRLRSAVRAQDMVARLGGDEFSILMMGQTLREEIDRLKRRLMLAVSEPVNIDGQEVYVTPSLGVSMFPHDSENIESMMRNADLAMYKAKESGRNELAYYDAEMTRALRDRRQLGNELRQAFERQEFEVYYQPIVEVASGCIVSAEGLVRWNHPNRGIVLPDDFIPVCEQNGMIQVLGRFVFKQAVRQQVLWASQGFDLRVSINLSARQLEEADLSENLIGIVQRAGAQATRFQLEITESMLLGHDIRILKLIHALQLAGFSIALDDFGTGYSNLAYLQRFPITALKIDRTFIHCIENDDSLAKMIVSLCRILKLNVIAEGVETPEQLEWVRAHKIEQFQGYLVSKPLPAQLFSQLDQRLDWCRLMNQEPGHAAQP